MDFTIDYYNNNAEKYISKIGTNYETKMFYDAVLPYLKKEDVILDYGCGPGRDTIFFQNCSFNVVSTDASLKMCEAAKRNGCKDVRLETFLDLKEENVYNLVWAMSSLLHAKKSEMPDIFNKVYHSLKENGIFYVNFRYGEGESVYHGRHFNNYDEKSFNELIEKNGLFKIKKLWINKDTRSERQNRENSWLNAVLQKIQK